MSRKAVLVAMAGALVFLTLGLTGADAASVTLSLPQSNAFAILGASCGGIQEQSYATGFDPVSGHPTGDVYLQTRCGGSGRGGGYHSTTYTAWAAVTWSFGGAVRSATRLASTPTVNGTLTVTDANGDTLTNSGGLAYLTVPLPGAPTSVTATPSSGQYLVAWAPGLANPAVVTSSTVTVTPIGSTTATVVTTTVSGSATSALVGPLQPNTTYAIVVTNTDAGGTSATSTPAQITTPAASLVPGAPTGVKARWTAPGSPSDTLVATWSAATGGDTPVDQYQITITGSDGGGTFTQTVPGSTLTAVFAVSDGPDWSVTVRAHNAAGWGLWSARFRLGGL